MSTGYQARLHRIGRWWAVDIPQAAVHTQCRTLDEAEALARDAIARAHGVRPDAVDVELVVPEFASLLHGVREARKHPAAGGRAGLRALADAARTLVDDLRVSQNDAGRLLGLSHQEMSRLAPPRTAAASRPWPALGPLSAPAGPASGTSSTGTTGTTDSTDSTDSTSRITSPAGTARTARPQRHRPPAPSRPSWAIAEDSA